jgi:hypothetical protein
MKLPHLQPPNLKKHPGARSPLPLDPAETNAGTVFSMPLSRPPLSLSEYQIPSPENGVRSAPAAEPSKSSSATISLSQNTSSASGSAQLGVTKNLFMVTKLNRLYLTGRLFFGKK